MYDNIGEKIKTVAIIIAIIEAIGFLIAGIIIANEAVGIGLALIFGGALFSWISSFILYGFGQLIVNTDIIASHYYKKQVDRHEKRIHQESVQAIKTIKDNYADSSEYVDFYCPLCGEKISYTKGQIRSNRVLSCPMCGESFNTTDAFKG